MNVAIPILEKEIKDLMKKYQEIRRARDYYLSEIEKLECELKSVDFKIVELESSIEILNK